MPFLRQRADHTPETERTRKNPGQREFLIGTCAATMSTPIQQIFAKVHSSASVAGSGLTFPQTVAALLALGVTRYHVDYTAGMVTTYTPATATAPATASPSTPDAPGTDDYSDHDSSITASAMAMRGIEQIPLPTSISISTPLSKASMSSTPSPVPRPSGGRWTQSGVQDAIRRAQTGAFPGGYTDFSRACIDAGVVGYIAFLHGQRVLYYGGEGDVHIEHFPASLGGVVSTTGTGSGNANGKGN